MLGTVKNFIDDRKGAFAMQFALLVVPLTVCTGLAIDGGRAFLARYELSAALDAAALAVGSTYNEDTDLNVVAHSFVNANFHGEHNGPIKLELAAEENEADEDIVMLKGTVTIDTYFMPLIGQPKVTVAAESQVKRGGANVEVALALDVTGSMDEKGPEGVMRIDGLKSASNLLIDKVVNPIQTPYFSKVAIVPWSAAVHVGSTHSNATVEDLRGSLVGTTGISGATWRKTATTTKTITEAGWRTKETVGGKSISGVSWKNGTPFTVTKITKLTSPDRIQVTTSGAHGYSNGDIVYFSGINTGSYTGLNGKRYKVADRTTANPGTYNLQDLGTTTYTAPPTGTLTNSTNGSSQRCWDSACNVGITVSSGAANHTLSIGDYAHITGVQGFTAVNNSDTSTWVVAAVPSVLTYTITMPDVFGPDLTQTYTSSSTDKSSECYVSDCRYRVTTSANHGFSTSDHIFMWGLTESGSNTSGNSAANSSWSIKDPSGSVFFLPNKGKDYRDWTANGSAAQCERDTCNVTITSASHNLNVNDRLRIRDATGLAGINNCDLDSGKCKTGSSTPIAWRVAEKISASEIVLADTSPSYPNMTDPYGSSGTAQCARYGCKVFWFLTSGGSQRVYLPSQCIVERHGSDGYTDTGPDDAPLGINYTADGTCTTSNYVTPLTSNKTRLTDAIAALKTGGSTAGQLGVGWGWYMLSPEFKDVWDKESENQPKLYTAKELVKVLVLMTDGEFNYASCNGVSSDTIGSTPNTAGNCVLPDTAFKQAEAMCEEVKKKKIVIYTVGLELDTALYGDDFLTKCATSSKHAFLASSNTELEDAFKKIAKEISKLRIAK